MLFGVVVAAQQVWDALANRVFDDADCEQLVTSRVWSLDEPCMLERDFNLSALSDRLPNTTYRTKFVYVTDVPRIDECVHALFIVPDTSDGSPKIKISNAHFLVNFKLDDSSNYDCDEKGITVTLFLGNVELDDVKIEYNITGNDVSQDTHFYSYTASPSE